MQSPILLLTLLTVLPTLLAAPFPAEVAIETPAVLTNATIASATNATAAAAVAQNATLPATLNNTLPSSSTVNPLQSALNGLSTKQVVVGSLVALGVGKFAHSTYNHFQERKRQDGLDGDNRRSHRAEASSKEDDELIHIFPGDSGAELTLFVR
jgi:hypothetical protein